MKQELAWGTAAAVAIAAAIGISSQSGGKPGPATSAEAQTRQTIITGKTPKKPIPEKRVLSQCAELIPLFENFFLKEPFAGPAVCYAQEPTPAPLDSKYHTRFLIATLPDPLYTHFSLLFDRFIEAIQQGAQDENYEYDSSWLPWDTEERAFNSLKDQDEADDRKEKREDQPGVLLFRGSSDSPYQNSLIVFVVGEESTRGIHRAQFENAVAWINALRPAGDDHESVAILGPTFSGSFASMADLLVKTDGMSKVKPQDGISIFSGSASSWADGQRFASTPGVHFRSFVQDDMTELDRVCRYFFGEDHVEHVAILSEDETAYGSNVVRENAAVTQEAAATQEGEPSRSTLSARLTKERQTGQPERVICPGAINIYYPRDISTLRAAYQTQSMFASGSAQSSQDSSQRKSLPTDLADPVKQQHDTVRTYARNQTPLSQEAQLLGIEDVLRSHRAEYVILRSSNNLDPLFLANFLRRDYSDARIIILNSDLLFQRGKDAMALSGVMTLSTYPLFSWARDWTALPFPDVHSHRVFPENSAQGTYIASRMLLQTLARANGHKPDLNCEIADETPPEHQASQIFAPPIQCEVQIVKTTESDKSGKTIVTSSAAYAPLADYGPPFWTEPDPCSSDAKGLRCRPATWLSVITRNGTWPLAAMNEHTLRLDSKVPSTSSAHWSEHWRWPGTPRTTKVLFVALCFLAVFHILCCWFASFTAKPAIRAHFATPGSRHTGLVLIASFLIALMTLFVAWGCGIFAPDPSPPPETVTVWAVLIFVWVVTGVAIAANIVATRKLNRNIEGTSDFSRRMIISLFIFAALTAAFFPSWVWPIESVMRLASRAFVYWRSMNLTSGVSPVLPFLSLTAGLYLWTWYALHGLALFGPDRPCLPPLETLAITIKTPQQVNHNAPKELRLSMFSQQNVAEPAERIATPLAWDNVILIVVLFAGVASLMFGLGGDVPVRSLGAKRYGLIFCLAICFYCGFLLAQAWQMWRTWSCARKLLVFLDRLSLRRTLAAMHGFSWGTVWKMSGNVLDVRYKLLSRQMECLNHLYTSLTSVPIPTTSEEQEGFAGVEMCKKAVNMARAEGARFAEWYSTNYDNPRASDLQKFRDFQKQIAETSGIILTQLVMPATRVEEHSLIQVDPEDSDAKSRKGPSPSDSELIRNAEELICLTYLGFIQNLLGRIRTIVLGGVYLFIALSIAISSYPFDPRTLLSGILLLLFLAFGGVVVFTYADMHRDATLSHVTNTNPGELGSEFWVKILGYGAAPLLGLLTQVFPEWSGFLFSWLQPGLSSLK